MEKTENGKEYTGSVVVVQKCLGPDSGGGQCSCHRCPQWLAALLAVVLLLLAVVLVVVDSFVWLWILSWFDNVSMMKAEIMEHCTTGYDLYSKGGFNLQCFKKYSSPPCLHYAECSFYHSPSPGVVPVVSGLNRTPHWLSEWSKESDGPWQARISPITNDGKAVRWIQPLVV